MPRVGQVALSTPNGSTAGGFTEDKSGRPPETLMLLHVVTLRWNDDVTVESIRALTENLALMAENLPMVNYFTCGAALRLRPPGADFALIVGVKDESALADYLNHPLHIDTLKTWSHGMVRERSAIQFFSPPPRSGV